MGLRRSTGRIPRRGGNNTASVHFGITNNAIIYLPKLKGIVILDIDENPVYTNEQFYQVHATIRPRRLYLERNQRQQGTDAETISIRGFFVKPNKITINEGVKIKEPCRTIINGQEARILLNITIKSGVEENLRLEGIVGEQFTGELNYV